MDLDHRVAVVLTQLHKKTMFHEQEVAEIVGAPVIRTFPNDYPAVHRALTNGTLLPAASELGKGFADFASLLMEQKVSAKPATQRRRFLEYVAFAPMSALGGRD